MTLNIADFVMTQRRHMLILNAESLPRQGFSLKEHINGYQRPRSKKEFPGFAHVLRRGSTGILHAICTVEAQGAEQNLMPGVQKIQLRNLLWLAQLEASISGNRTTALSGVSCTIAPLELRGLPLTGRLGLPNVHMGIIFGSRHNWALIFGNRLREGVNEKRLWKAGDNLNMPQTALLEYVRIDDSSLALRILWESVRMFVGAGQGCLKRSDSLRTGLIPQRVAPEGNTAVKARPERGTVYEVDEDGCIKAKEMSAGGNGNNTIECSIPHTRWCWSRMCGRSAVKWRDFGDQCGFWQEIDARGDLVWRHAMVSRDHILLPDNRETKPAVIVLPTSPYKTEAWQALSFADMAESGAEGSGHEWQTGKLTTSPLPVKSQRRAAATNNTNKSWYPCFEACIPKRDVPATILLKAQTIELSTTYRRQC
ncbi:uncharacterized protein BDR25DRAFT_352899 [Lindgomyces ingoldianus]|uniref:Uncharacterized protein n=1 Tax=Lindgomyces ingoldianus TaxID=673940 RepID=A0ACB6R2C9_9PLEO|nr:uncharacterized protein BDR25DRAFT_352899 [Lindgomyces ingoldianus]KAF2473479.1 hypothetical protein BDR25DRAFT_352899 [Lindgomyces ingoldianus]